MNNKSLIYALYYLFAFLYLFLIDVKILYLFAFIHMKLAYEERMTQLVEFYNLETRS